MKNFAERLRQARQDKGWNQDDLAKAVELSQGAISQFEKGLRIPTPANITKFSEILGVNRDVLVGEEEMSSDRVRLMRSIQTLSSEELKVVEGVVKMIKKNEPPSKAD
jgi:Predicted transcription factor, homolog of eukaryotic MBF1